MDFGIELNMAEAILVFLVSVFAGFIKGVVGFAFPMVMIGGLGLILDPALAVALLIFPLFAVNLLQALQGSLSSTLSILKEHIRLISALLTCLFLTAQVVWLFPDGILYTIIGIPIGVVAVLQLAGLKLRLPDHYRNRTEYVTGITAGIFGGFAGVWAPLVVTYLVAIDKSVKHFIQAQGVIYLAGSIMLIAAHFRSGILDGDTTIPSLVLVVPSVAGLAVGTALRNKLNNSKFRTFTLAVLAVAGFNLVLRAILS